MKTQLVLLTVVAILAVEVSPSRMEQPASERVLAPKPSVEGTRLVSGLPVAFVPNLGQWHHAGRYVARVGAMTVFLEDKGWSFTLVERTGVGKKESREQRCEDAAARGVAVRMTFAVAREPELVAEQQLPGRHNYFLGNDPAKWRSNVPLYGAVRYRGMQDGVDVLAREHDGRFEYDLLLKPGADLDAVEVVVEGIQGLRLDEEGALVMETVIGLVRMPVPLSWEAGPYGEKSPIACHYVLRGDNRFGFEVPGRQSGWGLVVDPGLIWATYLGGTAGDDPQAVAIDASGYAVVVGRTDSVDFPVIVGAFDTSHNGGMDVFVSRLSADGSALAYSTFVGGSARDWGFALALDQAGAATVVGSTDSTNFPTTQGAFNQTNNGGVDVFVFKLLPLGSNLVFSTYVGGTSYDEARGVALDGSGTATVSGATGSQGFPTTPGAFDPSHNGGDDAFVFQLAPSGATLVYSTFFGGSQSEGAGSVVLGPGGDAFIAGWTYSFDLPTTSAALSTRFGGSPSDGFVARLSRTTGGLVYSTFLGGMTWDEARAIAVDPNGAATVTGWTGSANFPTTPGAYDTTFNGSVNGDVFVTRLGPDGSSALYSTFIGGSEADRGFGLALDPSGAATVVGYTNSANFPTTPGALRRTHVVNNTGFVARLSPDGSNLQYSTLWWGAPAVAIDSRAFATVVGGFDAGFPTTPGTYDPTYNGNGDATVARLDMLPTGVNAFGASSPGCTGPLAISVTSMPRVGNAQFALTCGNAAPNAIGLIAFAGARLQAPTPLLGVDVWLDPTGLFVTATSFSNPIGACEVPAPIPNNATLAGLRFVSQFLWLGPTAPPPCPPQGFSASNALDFTIQP